MGQSTNIEWTDASWAVLNGCSRVSEGCRFCWSERLTATRLRNVPAYKGLAVMHNGQPQWTGEVRLNESVIYDPLHWKRPRRIFVSQMSDLFHESVPDEWIDEIFAVMALCPQHDFQCLTKRPQRMLEQVTRLSKNIAPLEKAARDMGHTLKFESCSLLRWPIPNIWLGVSVEDQKTADERIPLLLQTPAAVRWVSYEPALGPVDFRAIHYGGIAEIDSLTGDHGVYRPLVGKSESKISWIVVGAESGPGARPFDIQWARTTIAQCKAAGIACFVKQLGHAPYSSEEPTMGRIWPYSPTYTRGVGHIYTKLSDKKGGNVEEWPNDLRVREYPAER